MLWEVDIHPGSGQIDRAAQRIAATAEELGIATQLTVQTARGYLLQGVDLSAERIGELAQPLLVDEVVEAAVVAPVGAPQLERPRSDSGSPAADANGSPTVVHVLPKAGVMDPVALSAQSAMADAGLSLDAVKTLRKYWILGASADELRAICQRVLANDAIEQVVVGPLPFDQLETGKEYRFQRQHVAVRDLNDEQLMQLSRDGQLYLQLAEMQTIQAHYQQLGRDPTDVELETLAQTWSEHCSHKTLAGRIAYQDENGTRQFENMLKETIFAATRQLRAEWGEQDWCVSVFVDNAGVVRFDDEFNLAFKVETHNHPSALEPYGGANTGVGGVIRDTIGTGLGAKPICNTDVFCFAPPDTPADALPDGVLHPRRVMQGVVEGVRDYGNRMGIPTVNGAILFDERYLGNPLVFCGNVGLLPHDKSHKQPQAGDFIVAVGGKTGRDGIHGATFSSAELTSESEDVSGGAVQIGNAIEEKKVLDVLLAARDRQLFNAITDCGAGGFSSAVGEMGESIGAEVHLDRVPLKYQGLSYTEIWISEAQERMVLSVPPAAWDELSALCASEDVEATVLGKFVPSGRLSLQYENQEVGDLPMEFLHDGRPPVVRQARYQPQAPSPLQPNPTTTGDATATLLKLLGNFDICSKEWVVRQYDHEVQGGSVVKPFVGVAQDGPSDAAVLRPRLDSRQGIVVGCGINPRFGNLDCYHMAASAIDEAIRNCVAVGADPRRIALLDNFCWGDCERSETLGGLVRAAIACHDISLAFSAPFISGKDSLNNEFSYERSDGRRETIAIPPTLLISALGQIDDVARCVTMDLKEPGNQLYLVGETRDELGGSHFAWIESLPGGAVPIVQPDLANRVFAAIHSSLRHGCVRACHDLSEGGLAVSVAEMVIGGRCGAELDIRPIDVEPAASDNWQFADADVVRLFSESNTRFLCEVPGERSGEFEKICADVPVVKIGHVVDEAGLTIRGGEGSAVVKASTIALREAWQRPLDWSRSRTG